MSSIVHIAALLAGFIAWKVIGGIWGLLVGVFVVVPVIEGLFFVIKNRSPTRGDAEKSGMLSEAEAEKVHSPGDHTQER